MLAIAILGGLGSAAAIGTYLWSLRVASVRAQAVSVDGRIAATRDEIARLRMELVLRTRLVQQQWWAPALGLRTPDALQYGRDGAQLHALADARRIDIALRTTPPAAFRETGYAPQARHALNALISDISR